MSAKWFAKRCDSDANVSQICPISSAACRLSFSRRLLECARQRDKTLDRNLFGAFGRIDSGFFEQGGRIDTEGFQALPQHFPPLAERRLGDPLQYAAITGKRRRAWDD